MESATMDKRLAWLDDQRLKDAERVAKLADKVARLEQTLASQSKLVQELSGEISRLNALATRISQLDETLSKHRQEVSRLVRSSDERRTEKEKQVQQLAKVDQKELTKGLASLRKDVDRLGEIRESLAARGEEEMRMARALDAAEKRIDGLIRQDEERARSFLALRESRNQDDRRIQEALGLSADLHVKQEGLRGSIDALDDRTRRADVRLSELSASEAERLELQQLWVEQQGRRLVDFEHAWKGWEKVFATFEGKADQVEQRLQSFEETHRGARQLQQALEAALDRLERRITEIGEIKRLAEERFKQEWASFQVEDHRRWNTHKLTADEQWREHGRVHDRLGKESSAQQEALNKTVVTLAGFQDVERRHLAELLSAVRQWVIDLQEPSPPKR